MSASDWAAEQIETLADEPNVRILPRTTVWGYYDGNTIAAIERVGDHKAVSGKGEPRHRYWTIRAETVVLATGALERPIVFPGNDRPGVMLASAAERFANEFGVIAGRDIVVFTNNDSAYRSALALKKAGATITAIVDVRREISDAARNAARQCTAELLTGHAVVATGGGKELSGISVQPFDAATGQLSGALRGIGCDCLLVSGGWSPPSIWRAKPVRGRCGATIYRRSSHPSEPRIGSGPAP